MTGRKPRYRTIGCTASAIVEKATRSPSGDSRRISSLRRMYLATVRVAPPIDRQRQVALRHRGGPEVVDHEAARPAGQQRAARAQQAQRVLRPVQVGQDAGGHDQVEALADVAASRAPGRRPIQRQSASAAAAPGWVAGDPGLGPPQQRRANHPCPRSARRCPSSSDAKRRPEPQPRSSTAPADRAGPARGRRQVLDDRVVLEIVDLGQQSSSPGCEPKMPALMPRPRLTRCRSGAPRATRAPRRCRPRRSPSSTVSAPTEPQAGHRRHGAGPISSPRRRARAQAPRYTIRRCIANSASRTKGSRRGRPRRASATDHQQPVDVPHRDTGRSACRPGQALPGERDQHDRREHGEQDERRDRHASSAVWRSAIAALIAARRGRSSRNGQ